MGLARASNDLHVVLCANRVDFRHAHVGVRLGGIPNLVGPDPGDYHLANDALERVVTNCSKTTNVRR